MERTVERLDLDMAGTAHENKPAPPPQRQEDALELPTSTLHFGQQVAQYSPTDIGRQGRPYKPFPDITYKQLAVLYAATVGAAAIDAAMTACCWTSSFVELDEWYRGADGDDFVYLFRIACIVYNVRPYQEGLNVSFTQWAGDLRTQAQTQFFISLNELGKEIGIPVYKAAHPTVDSLKCSLCSEVLDVASRHWDHSSGSSRVNGATCAHCNTKKCMLMQRVGPAAYFRQLDDAVTHSYTASSVSLTSRYHEALVAGMADESDDESD